MAKAPKPFATTTAANRSNRDVVPGAERWVSLEDVKIETYQRVASTAPAPICRMGSVAGPSGLLAPVGAIAQVAAMQTLDFKGAARDVVVSVSGGCRPSTTGAHVMDASKSELEKRKKSWNATARLRCAGALRTDADLVGPAFKIAAMHAGRKADVVCYADI